MREAPIQGPLLEVGSGIGTFARQLGRCGYHVIAVDISDAKTLKAQRLTAKGYSGTTTPLYHGVGELRDLGIGTALDVALYTGCPWPVPRRFRCSSPQMSLNMSRWRHCRPYDTCVASWYRRDVFSCPSLLGPGSMILDISGPSCPMSGNKYLSRVVFASIVGR